MAAGGNDNGGGTVALLCGGGQCFAAVFPVRAEAQVSSFSSLVVQQGEENGEMLRKNDMALAVLVMM